jgi:fluoride exporter
MHQLQIVLVIAAAGALGALARYGSVLAATQLLGDRFPYGTLLVNVVGCLVMGLAAAALPDPHEKSQLLWLRYGLMVGFLGAYTTFSAFSLDTLKHLQEGGSVIALLNVLANVLLCLAAVWSGMRIGSAVF